MITWNSDNEQSRSKVLAALDRDGKAVVDGMPEHEYFAFPALGSSQLMEVRRCPRYFWHGSPWCPEEERREKKRSEALEFGSQIHKYLLEPDMFYDAYRVEPDASEHLVTIADLIDYGQTQGVELPKGKTKAELIDIVLQRWPHAPVWSETKKRFEEDLDAGNFQKITHDKMELVKKMAEALKREVFTLGDRDVPLGMVFKKGAAERTFIWRHAKTGLDVMCRVDWMLANIVFEYRTAADASPRGFAAAARKRNYHIRAGFYWKIIMEATGASPQYYYMAQEKEDPYLVGLYEQPRQDLESGWSLAEECLEVVAECLSRGAGDRTSWPSYNENRVVALDLPDWAFTPIEGGE